MATVNLAPTDYASQLQDIQRRQKMAELLQQQGMSPIEANPTAGGYVIPTSWTQGLAKVLQSGLGAYQQNKLMQEQKNLGQQAMTEAQNWATSRPQDTPAIPPQSVGYGQTPVDSTPEQVQGMIQQEAGTPGQTVSPQEKAAWMIRGMNNPVSAPFASKAYGSMLDQQDFMDQLKAIQGLQQPAQTSAPASPTLTGNEPIPNGVPDTKGFQGDPTQIVNDVATISDPKERAAAMAQLLTQHQGATSPAPAQPNPLGGVSPFLMSTNPRIQAIGNAQQQQELKQMMINAAAGRQDKTIAASNDRQQRGFDFQEKLRQGTQLNPTDLTLMADQYLHGDKSVFQNLGRGMQGAQNIVALRREITKQMGEQGLSGADQAAKLAEYAGLVQSERTVGAKSANIEMAADEASQMIPLARQASSEVVRSGFLPFGKAQIMFDENTNDPALRKFAAANNALVNVYARAVSPNGVTTVSDKDHARAILATAHDQASYNATLDMMEKEIKTAQAAPGHVRAALGNALTGNPNAQPARRASDAAPVRKYNPATGKIE